MEGLEGLMEDAKRVMVSMLSHLNHPLVLVGFFCWGMFYYILVLKTSRSKNCDILDDEHIENG